MSLILAIEPDKRQSGQLATVVNGLHAELVLRGNFADALGALQDRVPDLVLTTSLISPRDDAALAAHLRELGPAAAHVQTVTIPVLGTAAPRPAKGGMLAALRREKAQDPVTDGCTPDVFGEQIRQYLAAAERQKIAAAARHASGPAPAPPEPDWFAQPEPELFAAPPVAEVEETLVAETEEFVADEPAGLPLSQLLQFVTDTAVPEEPTLDEAAPIADVEPMTEVAPADEEEILFAAQPEPRSELESDLFVDPEPVVEPAGDFGDLYVDPMAAQALDELSRQPAPPSLADGIPAEAPVPVVEMHAFQSLDSIASELAAGPSQRYESLDDLASLFAAAPAPKTPAAVAPARVGRTHDLTVPLPDDTSPFASLFAAPTPAPAPRMTALQPDVDASLFASAPAVRSPIEAEIVPAMEELAFELDTFEGASAVETTPAPVFESAPEPELVAPTGEPVGEPFAALGLEIEPEAEPEPDPYPEPELEAFFEEPAAIAAAMPLDEEVSLDVDAFLVPPVEPVKPQEPIPFAFTLVDGFGDAWSDFEVSSEAGVAADLGVGEHAPSDPYAFPPAAEEDSAQIELVAEDETPALDAEALSLIGDAARKVSLDALVIEDFARELEMPRPKKAKKKHAGATQVQPAAERPAKPAKRPVQDEWGMFDPEQCGFAALEDDEEAEARPRTGTRVRVISY
jgi:hypothetical protein